MSWQDTAPWATAVVSLFVALLAHVRGTKAQNDQHDIDRDKLINEAYSDVLSELRAELSRIQETLDNERKQHEREAEALNRRVADLEDELRRERQLRSALEAEVAGMKRELKTVERRREPRQGDEA